MEDKVVEYQRRQGAIQRHLILFASLTVASPVFIFRPETFDIQSFRVPLVVIQAIGVVAFGAGLWNCTVFSRQLVRGGIAVSLTPAGITNLTGGKAPRGVRRFMEWSAIASVQVETRKRTIGKVMVLESRDDRRSMEIYLDWLAYEDQRDLRRRIMNRVRA